MSGVSLAPRWGFNVPGILRELLIYCSPTVEAIRLRLDAKSPMFVALPPRFVLSKTKVVLLECYSLTSVCNMDGSEAVRLLEMTPDLEHLQVRWLDNFPRPEGLILSKLASILLQKSRLSPNCMQALIETFPNLEAFRFEDYTGEFGHSYWPWSIVSIFSAVRATLRALNLTVYNLETEEYEIAHSNAKESSFDYAELLKHFSVLEHLNFLGVAFEPNLRARLGSVL